MDTERLLLNPQTKDLGGGFTVRRLLPAALRQAVGPFVFFDHFDHFGPVDAGPADNHDVRPHPHIGLATVTYLFEGAMQHHDSTGVAQRIEAGAINWMTAGRGIVHSERAPAEERAVYVVEGRAQLDGDDILPGRMVVLAADEEPMLSADADARVVMVGGASLGHRHIWWNFVSSRKERIAQAADDWAAQRMGVVAGETEFIPLPDKRPT